MTIGSALDKAIRKREAQRGHGHIFGWDPLARIFRYERCRALRRIRAASCGGFEYSTDDGSTWTREAGRCPN